MLRRKNEKHLIEITDTKFSEMPIEVIENTVQQKFHGKMIGNGLVTSVKLINTGPVFPVIQKGTIARVSVSLDFETFVIPLGIILPKCKFVEYQLSETQNIDESYYQFSLETTLVDPSSVIIAIPGQGLSSHDSKKLANLEVGDIIPLYVVNVNGIHEQKKIGCFCKLVADFNDNIAFIFTKDNLTEKDFTIYGKIEAGTPYQLIDKKLIVAKKPGNVIDFLKTDQLYDYLEFLAAL